MAGPRGRGDEPENSEARDGRWQRRAARHAAERRRMPKHGKAYVALARQMIAQRAASAIEDAPTSAPAGRRRTPRSAPTARRRKR
jgi:hypothetical protein